MSVLAQILAAILRVLGLTSSVLSIASSLGNLFQPQQGGSTWLQVSNEVGTSLSEIENGTYGLNALAGLIATARSDILAAVALTQQAGSPVTLPSTFPSGWNAGIASQASSGVWSHLFVNPNLTGEQILDAVAFSTFNRNGAGILYKLVGTFFTWVKIRSDLNSFDEPVFNLPFFDDPSAILPNDDIASWLTRLNPGYTISADANNIFGAYNLSGPMDYVVLLNAQDFARLQFQAATGLVPTTAPVWPGLSGVFLGNVVPFAGDITVPTNMQGVIIEITTVPAGTSFFDFDGTPSWRWLGAVAFQDDNGQFEQPQNLGFGSQVYLPKSMGFATAAVLRVKPGVVGTLQTFSIP